MILYSGVKFNAGYQIIRIMIDKNISKCMLCSLILIEAAVDLN